MVKKYLHIMVSEKYLRIMVSEKYLRIMVSEKYLHIMVSEKYLRIMVSEHSVVNYENKTKPFVNCEPSQPEVTVIFFVCVFSRFEICIRKHRTRCHKLENQS